MQIVIEIPDEETYSRFIRGAYYRNEMSEVLRNGTRLPKGHGDLIDKNDLLVDSYSIDDWSGNEINIIDVMTVKMADAIIEADVEG